MLVVVKDRDITLLLQLPFDLKASGRGNVFQIDAPKGAGDVIHRLDKFIYVLSLDT